MNTLGGQQASTIVSEPGLYKLIQSSKKPGAKAFDRGVRHEGSTSIRKTGTYAKSLTGDHQRLTSAGTKL